MPKQSFDTVAVVGATGAVGSEMIACLETRNFPLKQLRLLASPRSAGKRVRFRGGEVEIAALDENAFAGVDLALFAAGSGITKTYAPIAIKAGAVVVDNSSAFRMDAATPLVVPEVNAAAMEGHRGLIANPNCTAAIMIMALWPLHQVNPLQRVIAATYQAASGAGAAAMQELEQSTRAYLAGEAFTPKVLPHPYAFNVFNHNTEIDPETGANGEEAKVIQEMRKIMGLPDLRVGVTCVRVPVLRAHCMAVSAEFAHPMAESDARALLAKAAGVRVVDDRAANHFPMPNETSGGDDVLVGRIRPDQSDPSGRSLMLFISGDQLRKGAALNAVQIAERLLCA
jgi:aspartate-semialdehyde dehydrogenase